MTNLIGVNVPGQRHIELDDVGLKVGEQIQAGRSDEQILDFMVARYGDFVLYRPPLKSHTFLLWFGPAVLALTALVAFARALRNRRRRLSDTPLSSAEQAEAERLLANPGGAEP